MDTPSTTVMLYLSYGSAVELYCTHVAKCDRRDQAEFETHFSEQSLAFIDVLGAKLEEYYDDSPDSVGGFRLVFDHDLEMVPLLLPELGIEPKRVEIRKMNQQVTLAKPGVYNDYIGRVADIQDHFLGLGTNSETVQDQLVTGPTLAAAQTFLEGVCGGKRNSLYVCE